MAQANPMQVEKYLRGINYPVSKADLIKYARQQGADESIRALLEKMPNQTFDSPASVSKAVAQASRA
jgi:hypothetical protein